MDLPCARLVVGGLDKAGSTTIFVGARRHPGFTVAYTPYRTGGWRPAATPDSGILLERYNGLLYDTAAQDALRSSPGRSRVVVSLRDPVARVPSMYHHRFGLGRLPVRMDLAEFVRVQLDGCAPARSDDFLVVERGRYAPHLEQLWERFGQANVDLVIFEEWRQDPYRMIADVAERAGLDPAFLPQLPTEQVNPSGVQRHPRMMRAAHLLGRRSIRPVRGTRYEVAHRSRVDRSTRWLYRRTIDSRNRPALMPAEIEARLVAYYEESTARLEELLGRTLPWQRSVNGASSSSQPLT